MTSELRLLECIPICGSDSSTRTSRPDLANDRAMARPTTAGTGDDAIKPFSHGCYKVGLAPVMPPSTGITTPVTKLAALDAR